MKIKKLNKTTLKESAETKNGLPKEIEDILKKYKFNVSYSGDKVVLRYGIETPVGIMNYRFDFDYAGDFSAFAKDMIYKWESEPGETRATISNTVLTDIMDTLDDQLGAEKYFYPFEDDYCMAMWEVFKAADNYQRKAESLRAGHIVNKSKNESLRKSNKTMHHYTTNESVAPMTDDEICEQALDYVADLIETELYITPNDSYGEFLYNCLENICPDLGNDISIDELVHWEAESIQLEDYPFDYDLVVEDLTMLVTALKNKYDELVANNLVESLKGRKQMKNRKKLREGYRGTDIRFIYHGDWSDPELEDKDGYLYNYWDIEDALWNMFLEENSQWTDNDSDNTKCEKEFNAYVQDNVEWYLEEVKDAGYFIGNDGREYYDWTHREPVESDEDDGFIYESLNEDKSTWLPTDEEDSKLLVSASDKVGDWGGLTDDEVDAIERNGYYNWFPFNKIETSHGAVPNSYRKHINWADMGRKHKVRDLGNKYRYGTIAHERDYISQNMISPERNNLVRKRLSKMWGDSEYRESLNKRPMKRRR